MIKCLLTPFWFFLSEWHSKPFRWRANSKWTWEWRKPLACPMGRTPSSCPWKSGRANRHWLCCSLFIAFRLPSGQTHNKTDKKTFPFPAIPPSEGGVGKIVNFAVADFSTSNEAAAVAVTILFLVENQILLAYSLPSMPARYWLSRPD